MRLEGKVAIVSGGASGNVSGQFPEPGELVDPDSLIEITFEE
mgnify:CR=1 FL=1